MRTLIASLAVAALATPAQAQSEQVQMALWCSYTTHLASQGLTAPDDIARRKQMTDLSEKLLNRARELAGAEGVSEAQFITAAKAATDPAGLPDAGTPRYDINACADLTAD